MALCPPWGCRPQVPLPSMEMSPHISLPSMGTFFPCPSATDWGGPPTSPLSSVGMYHPCPSAFDWGVPPSSSPCSPWGCPPALNKDVSPHIFPALNGDVPSRVPLLLMGMSPTSHFPPWGYLLPCAPALNGDVPPHPSALEWVVPPLVPLPSMGTCPCPQGCPSPCLAAPIGVSPSMSPCLRWGSLPIFPCPWCKHPRVSSPRWAPPCPPPRMTLTLKYSGRSIQVPRAHQGTASTTPRPPLAS